MCIRDRSLTAGDFDDATDRCRSLQSLHTATGHQPPGDGITLLLIRPAPANGLALQILITLRETAGSDHSPVQTTGFKRTFADTLPDQDQTEQVEGMPPAAGTEGTDQHHTGDSDTTATLHLALHAPGIHTHRTTQIDRGASTCGDHQGIHIPQGLIK